MSQFFAALMRRLLWLWLLALLALPCPVTAAMYRFTAHSNLIDEYPSFTLLFDDVGGDGRFSLDELVGDVTFDYSDGPNHHVIAIWQTPATGREGLLTDYYALSGPGYPGFEPLMVGWWGLVVERDASLGGGSYVNWHGVAGGAPMFGESVSPVPLPPTALLLGSGLIPLAWARRKKRVGQ